MSNTIRFLKTAGIYFIGNVVTKMISFLLLPLYTSKINSNSFGYYDLSISLINLIVPLIFFQIWDAVFRFIFDYDDVDQKYKIIINGLIMILIGIIIYTIVLLEIDIDYKYLIYLSGITTAFTYFYSSVARGFMKNQLFVISGTINSIVNISLNVIMVGFMGVGVEALYISAIAGAFVQIIIIEGKMKILSHFKIKYISFKILREMIRFSVPIGISTISYWLLSGLTRVVISFSVGMDANGLYAVANRFASIMILAFSVFQFAWNELSYIVVKDLNKDKIYEKGSNIILIALVIGTSITIPTIKIIFPYIIDQSYYEAIYIIPPIIIGAVANSYATFLGTIFLANKNSIAISISTIFSAVINILALIILVPRYGLIGAVYALFIGFMINSILRAIVIKRLYGIRTDIKIVFAGIVLMILSLGVYFYGNNNIIIGTIIFISVSSIYTFKDWIKIILKNIKLKKSISSSI